MQILITHGSLARTRVLRLNRWQLGAAMVVLGGMLLLAGGALVHLLLPRVTDVVTTAAPGEARQRDRFLRENLDAMARKVGEVQAKLIKLEVMGDRVSGLAGVKADELKPTSRDAAAAGGPARAASGAGGPYLPVVSREFDALARQLEALDARVDEHSDRFTWVESRLMETRLATLLVPSSAPVDSGVGSPFGFRSDPFTGRTALHTGLDFPAESGTKVKAAAGGVVHIAAYHPDYGNLLELDHGNGLVTRYAHNAKFLVATGDLVKRGQAISEVGSTGRSTGAHLHFEVLVDGVPQNPARFLRGGANVASARLPHRH